jgi:dihydropyrimidinase
MECGMAKVFDLVIKNGRIVYPEKIINADLGIRGGRIAEVGPDLEVEAGDSKFLDAAGCYVLPGVIDPHVHPVYMDDIKNTSRTAAFGGVTTCIHYAYAKPGQSLVEIIRQWKAEGLETSYTDFALHGGLFKTIEQLEEIPAAMELGVTSFKMFMAYAKLGWMTDDYALIKAMDTIGEQGGMAALHAENGQMIDYIQDKMLKQKVDFSEHFVESRPAVTEMEAIFRAAQIGRYMNCPVYIPHISSAEGIDMVKNLKRDGFHIYAETCPHYLALTWDTLKSLGPLGKVGPCIRYQKDQDALWEALMDGTLDALGSDHAPKDKKVTDDFFSAPYGSPQIETMLPVIWQEGVNTGRMTPRDAVRLLSQNNAEIAGIADRKGRLDCGMDADVVIFDPDEHWIVSSANQHTNAGYTLFEGKEIQGRVRHVLNRGKLVIENAELTGVPGGAEFIPTKAGKWRPSNIQL